MIFAGVFKGDLTFHMFFKAIIPSSDDYITQLRGKSWLAVLCGSVHTANIESDSTCPKERPSPMFTEYLRVSYRIFRKGGGII